MAKKKVEEEKVEKVEIIEEDNDYDYEEENFTVEERIINIEKKVKASFWLNIMTTVLIVFLLILLLGGGNASSTGTGESTGTDTQGQSGYDTSAFNAIYPEDIASLSKKKTIVVWIGYQNCGFCQAYAPLLTQVTKEYGITANYIDLTTVTQDQMNIILSLKGEGSWENFAASFEGTPFTLIIKNNKVIGGIGGYAEADKIAKAFDNAGIKKK